VIFFKSGKLYKICFNLSYEVEFGVWLCSSVDIFFYVLWLFGIIIPDGFLGVKKAASFIVKSFKD